ncbi:putative PEP-binding protein [Butyricicoccus sp. Marseille-Q5471]|uniref:putative PEP-binding protein n=1 Tax=Butyricicoccus sp. Marseille-Q5471 TaxID=3039493 RepID=UPI0024BD4440|nr:putative PEP-binding protein [Butyricicoccus sp. Marseille-Q5471]
MKYIAAIDAVEELETLEQTDGVMLTGEDCLIRMEDQRLLMQSLLLNPPQVETDKRLAQMLHSQHILWLEKIEECARSQLCIRLPDRPADDMLPQTQAEFARLADYTGQSAAELQEQVASLRSVNPDLSSRGCRMMIDNELLFRTLLRAMFIAADQRGVHELSILLPFVSDAREVQFLKAIIAQHAATYQITCAIGIEIATPRAACIAEELAVCADAIVFNVEELVQLLYGMSQRDSKKVLCRYLHEKVFRHNPFHEFDEIGIGTLLTIALEQIRRVKPNIRLSAIGHPVLCEKGRKFCNDMGIDMLIGQQHLFRMAGVLESAT